MSRDEQNSGEEGKDQPTSNTPALPESAASGSAPAATDGAPEQTASNGDAAVEQSAQQTEASSSASSAQTQPQDIKTQKEKPQNEKPQRKKSRGLRFLLWLLVLAAVVAALVVGVREAQRRLDLRDQATEERLEALQSELAQTQQRLSALNQNYSELRSSQGEQSSREQQLQKQLDDMQQALAYQRDRLRAIASTTREDWLLAEAEYLLKLANQRLLIERSTDAAVGLLEEADKILRDLDDPELTPLRRAIARDLTQLKLAARVDLEGLYLRLAALAESVPQLPTLSRRQAAAVRSQQQQVQQPEPEAPGPWWQRAQRTLAAMFDDFGSYVRIRDHAERPTPILPPDSAQYLQQNLRFMLERAQLAAMREEAELYQRSMQNVVEWARQYYPATQQLENFLQQASELAEVDVQQELPDITQSLRLMTDYIDRLRKLEGVPDVGEDSGEAANGEAQ